MLPTTATGIDQIIQSAQSSGRTPALVAAVVADGEIAHLSCAGGYGVPEASWPTGVAETQFRLGSITKTLTAAVLMQLREEGRLDLDDPLGDYVPTPGLERVRLRHLMAHCGGLQREPDGLWWERNTGTPLARLVQGISAEKLAFPAYQTFHYSNLAYGLLGGVIEAITGDTWLSAITTRLLTPLGMGRTTYHATEPFARGYVVHPWQQQLREEPRRDAASMAPAGQLWSTVTDLARFAGLLTPPGEPGILSPAAAAMMAAPSVISDPDSWSHGYGLGMQLWRHGERVYVGHTGSMPGYLAFLGIHRRSKIAAIVFANSYGLSGQSIVDLGFSILETAVSNERAPAPQPWRPTGEPPAEINALCAKWYWMGREFTAHWDAPQQHLVLDSARPNGPHWRFVAEGADRWRCLTEDNAGELLRVRRDEAGRATALDIATFVFTREPFPDDQL